jgi:hypothetical protein
MCEIKNREKIIIKNTQKRNIESKKSTWAGVWIVDEWAQLTKLA